MVRRTAATVQPLSVALVLSVSVSALLINSWCVSAYNLSPKPNAVLRDPQLATGMPKVESSYFGFTVNLRPLGIIVGAPRAQSTLPLQRNVNETGAIYRCSLTDSTCSPYVFDDKGNRIIEASEYTYDSEKRDYQWLGASMDGGTSDSDKLVVCAPRFIAPAVNDYLMHGLCYWINDTLSGKPTNVNRISPLRLKQDQVREFEGKRFYFYMLSELGLSAHITPDNEEFLIGAPGIHGWKGSVIHNRRKVHIDDPSLSRRDTDAALRRAERQATDTPTLRYESEVLNPAKWDQADDSYFGYAVGSGYFDSSDKHRLLYVATAPQANQQSGEAYLFDMVGKGINKHYVFRGTQFGEYFGYSVLTEDLNNDGLTDVIISAPQYSISGIFDDGAIYVFINQGRYNFERKLLTSPFHGKSRFGTTLSKLGDINHDGYNDVAVGAPFHGNGSIYVYLGNEQGLRDVHSQRLDSPFTGESPYGVHMYGHGLSKGVDIDHNGFNDLAVGAPNAEKVFLYRAYPVVKIFASINSNARELKTDQNTFKAKVCYRIATTTSQMNSQDLAIRIAVDPQVKRVKIRQAQTNELQINVTATTGEQCQVIDCDVRYSAADIFKPIELELHYELIKKIPDSEVFCTSCAAVDPAEPTVYTEKIIFSTGCASDICIADLKVNSINLANTFILGSSPTLTVNYDITNSGETAYLPQINITSSNRMPFARVPSNCKLEQEIALLCDLNRGQPMGRGRKDSIQVIYDSSGLTGNAITLTARVFSTGREQTPGDNIARDVITLNEFTEVEAIGVPKTGHINLEKVFNSAEIINNYEIRSHGPSTVGALEIVFNIPIAYKVAGSSATIPIIDMHNISMQAVYDSQLVGIDFYQNNTQLLMNTIELESGSYSKISKVALDNPNSIHYDSAKMGHVNEIIGEQFLSDSVMTASMSRRRRRDVAATATKDQYERITKIKAHDLLSDELKGKLPVNRTIVFNCNDPEMTICVRAVLRVYKFKPEKPIIVNMKYTANLKEINQILIEPWEFFVVLIGLDVAKVGDKTGTTLAVVKKIEYNIISKHQLYSTPIWIFIVAVLGGLLLLALMTYAMYKLGFFKRAKKEEMDRLVHQGRITDEGETETENLNTERN